MVQSEQHKHIRRNRVILVGIALLFVAPILLAWLFAGGILDTRSRGLVNHGDLLIPPIDVGALPPSTALAPVLDLRPSAWAVLFIDTAPCAELCKSALDRLWTIRTLLGNAGERVSVLALLAAESNTETTSSTPQLQVLYDPGTVNAIIAKASAQQPGLHLPGIAFVDWRSQLMMSFAPDAPSKDILADLKRLLKASEIR